MTWTPEGHTLEGDLSRIKREILADIIRGVVPPTIDGTADLHGYVDANCYGGWCDDGEFSKLCDSEGVMLDEALDYLNSITATLDCWIDSGEHLRDLILIMDDLCDALACLVWSITATKSEYLHGVVLMDKARAALAQVTP